MSNGFGLIGKYGRLVGGAVGGVLDDTVKAHSDAAAAAGGAAGAAVGAVAAGIDATATTYLAPGNALLAAGGAVAGEAAKDIGRGVGAVRDAVAGATKEGERIAGTVFRPGGTGRPGFGVPGFTVPGFNLPGFPRPTVPTFPRPTPLPPHVFPTPLPFPPAALKPKTATQLAQSAIEMLDAADASTLNAALSTIKAKHVAGAQLIDYLERRVRVGEVLQRLATHWSRDTKEDFGAAFQLGVDKLDVMDLIVAISILSDADLDDEVRAEHVDDASTSELLGEKRIVWQHPPAGSVLEPPYMVLLAVEHRDVAEAERIVDSILEKLTAVDGFRLTKAAAARVRTGGRMPIRAGIAGATMKRGG